MSDILPFSLMFSFFFVFLLLSFVVVFLRNYKKKHFKVLVIYFCRPFQEANCIIIGENDKSTTKIVRYQTYYVCTC